MVFITPPGIVVAVPRNISNDVASTLPTTRTIPCRCSLDTSALFPEGAPSPALPLSRCALHEILLALPSNLQHYPWRVCFDTERNGFSLQNFYRMMRNVHANGESGIGLFFIEPSCPFPSRASPRTKLAPNNIRPLKRTVIGCFTPHVPCLEHSQHAFFGTHETFVFTFADVSFVNRRRGQALTPSVSPVCHTVNSFSPTSLGYASSFITELPTSLRSAPILKKFSWVPGESNTEFMVCANTFFGVGGGRDGAAIFVDENLRGTSSVFCSTFASPSLTGLPSRSSLHHSEFEIKRMVWFALKDRRRDFRNMEHAQPQPCDCNRFLECRGSRCVLRSDDGLTGWHVCQETFAWDA